ncbi:IclR family transcriptional regulator [Nocardia mangyaensis]|uniref:IclR family transcriptional regulator n=1 Tax=Nocardia mangyaensis TaxID=2213200 RepID=UPI0026744BC7|nr:IclR family transcriptional regulator [Nocardia mangyaensis]MDO3646853.1 IclR family transcriptional regulator [Nocardia mangyaensis]
MTVDIGVALRPVPHAARTPVSMIERMTLILDTFDGPAPMRTLVEVVERTGLPRSSVHRIIEQMIRLRWLAHAPGGYRLGTRALELGGLAIEHNEIRDVMGPLLHELCRRTGMVAHLGVLDGPEVLLIDKAVGRGGDSLPTRLGGRLPAHSTAVGKALLAIVPPSVIELAFPERLPQLTSQTIGRRAELHGELDQVRCHRGVAIDRAESLPDVVCVAVPIRADVDGGVAALSLSGRVGGQSRPGTGRLAQILVEAADEAERAVRTHLRRRHRG